MNIGLGSKQTVAYPPESTSASFSSSLLTSLLTDHDDLKSQPHTDLHAQHVWRVWLLIWQQCRQLSASNARMLVLYSALAAVLSMPILLSAYLGVAVDAMQYTLDWSAFIPLSVLCALAVVLGLFAEWQGNRSAARLNSLVCHHLVERVWWRLMSVRSLAYGQFAQSELVSRLTDTTETLQKHQLFVIQQLIRSLFVVTVTIVVLLSHHPVFIVLVAAFVFITCYWPIVIAKTADPAIAEEPRQLARVNGLVTSAIGQQLALRFTRGNGVLARCYELLKSLALNQADKWWRWNVSFNTKVTLNLLSHISILGCGGFLYLQGAIELADLVVVYVLSSMVIPRLDNLYKIYNYLQSLRVCYDKLAQLEAVSDSVHVVADEKAESKTEKTEKIQAIESLTLQHLGFRYPEKTQAVFSDLNLTFLRGQSYFIHGRSGSGKTTLGNLIAGLVQRTSGDFLINGHEQEAFNHKDYWARLSLHDQSNLVLEQLSVIDNIKLFLRDSQDQNLSAEIELRLQRAIHVLDFESCLHKPVRALSGGEKQRLCFIRSYIKPADIYLFDEATAAMDRNTETQLMRLILGDSSVDSGANPEQSIPSLCDNAMVIFISHNLHLAERFDHQIDLLQEKKV